MLGQLTAVGALATGMISLMGAVIGAVVAMMGAIASALAAGVVTAPLAIPALHEYFMLKMRDIEHVLRREIASQRKEQEGSF